MRDLSHLSISDLKSVAKYYRAEHKSRIKRIELEVLIYLAEVSNGVEIIEGYNNALEAMETEAQDISNSDLFISSP